MVDPGGGGLADIAPSLLQWHKQLANCPSSCSALNKENCAFISLEAIYNQKFSQKPRGPLLTREKEPNAGEGRREKGGKKMEGTGRGGERRECKGRGKERQNGKEGRDREIDQPLLKITGPTPDDVKFKDMTGQMMTS